MIFIYLLNLNHDEGLFIGSIDKRPAKSMNNCFLECRNFKSPDDHDNALCRYYY